jgi:hypothetical protein
MLCITHSIYPVEKKLSVDFDAVNGPDRIPQPTGRALPMQRLSGEPAFMTGTG